jgi:predicted transcriptional regulator
MFVAHLSDAYLIIHRTKNHLKKHVEDRAYANEAKRPRIQVIKATVREFVDRVFNGSTEPLLIHLIKERRLSPKELEKIARTIEEAE